MGSLDLSSVPKGALLLVDSAPIIYVMEMHPKWRPHFRPIFEAHDAKQIRLAITTIAIAEVLIGPLRSGDVELTHRYRSVFATWQQVDLDLEIAEGAAQ